VPEPLLAAYPSDFCRVHQPLRVTPAMEAGLSDHVWTDWSVYWRTEMGMGVNAVKAEIMSEFNVTQLAEHYDVDSASIHIGFRTDGRHFLVSVSEEFDQDFGSFPQIDLSRLGNL
jgi:hypothetical protein